ncbi:MAG: selenium cofactor biosynthesis protein YqeC [Candidatus Bathyarchaeia archaeon]
MKLRSPRRHFKKGRRDFRVFSRLVDAFSVRDGEVVTLVGAGGKTLTMFSLARELATIGKNVVTTTTTRIEIPSSDMTKRLLINPTAEELGRALSRYGHVTCGWRIIRRVGKVAGVKPEVIRDWLSLTNVDCVIVEADGSKKRPFKAPAKHEPVIPPSTTLYIPVLGADALGKRLSREHAHRPKLVARLTGMRLGDPITLGALIQVMNHYLEMAPRGSRSLAFVNKVDDERTLDRLEPMVDEVMTNRVILGSVFGGKYWVFEGEG